MRRGRARRRWPVGSVEGALKTAATKTGLSLDAYRARIAAGEKWCTGCKAWHATNAFPVDRSRWDGRRAKCLAAERGNDRPRRRIPHHDAARNAVARAVKTGELSRPDAVACTDCGHSGDERRHEYDHTHGYERERWLTVEAVCTLCHADREKARRRNV